jgi:hypothetical protein
LLAEDDQRPGTVLTRTAIRSGAGRHWGRAPLGSRKRFSNRSSIYGARRRARRPAHYARQAPQKTDMYQDKSGIRGSHSRTISATGSVRAENRIHSSDQQGCSSGAAPMMITHHVPAARVPPDRRIRVTPPPPSWWHERMGAGNSAILCDLRIFMEEATEPSPSPARSCRMTLISASTGSGWSGSARIGLA